MFDQWYRNFKLLVRDTYGVGERPFRWLSISDLRPMYEAGKSEKEAIAEFAGQWFESGDD